MIGKTAAIPPARAPLSVTGRARPPMNILATTGAAPAATTGRPRGAARTRGIARTAKAAVLLSSLGLCIMIGLALALLRAAFTRDAAIVGVVPVNVDVGTRVAFPDGLPVVLGVVRGVVRRVEVDEERDAGAEEIELEPLEVAVEPLLVTEGLLEVAIAGGRVAVLLG
ncbi:hypothetical protein GP486_003576 [Trichoglossum hirsutum]|uniref:Uncharacterized protein n=1 Tax=Trichoglossum hirsutum TaxID=265104 RepID=A0A9P8RQH5_9PEZI|nr:hypothetical protein GP486_003576 [Trichoglossum hirsutum]